jgi:hypothetical protein
MRDIALSHELPPETWHKLTAMGLAGYRKKSLSSIVPLILFSLVKK